MKKQINLNPKILEKKKKNIDLEIMVSSILIFVVLLCCYGGYSIFKLYNLNSEKANLQNEVNNLDISGLNTNLKNNIKTKEDDIESLKKLDNKYNVYQYLSSASNITESGVSIIGINFTEGKVSIEGIADNSTQVANFLTKLKKIDLYKEAYIGDIKEVKPILNPEVPNGALQNQQQNNISNNSSDNNENSKINDKNNISQSKNNSQKTDKVQFSIYLGGNTNG